MLLLIALWLARLDCISLTTKQSQGNTCICGETGYFLVSSHTKQSGLVRQDLCIYLATEVQYTYSASMLISVDSQVHWAISCSLLILSRHIFSLQLQVVKHHSLNRILGWFTTQHNSSLHVESKLRQYITSSLFCKITILLFPSSCDAENIGWWSLSFPYLFSYCFHSYTLNSGLEAWTTRFLLKIFPA